MANPTIVPGTINTGNFTASSLTSTTVTSNGSPTSPNAMLACMVIQGTVGDPGVISPPSGWSQVQQNLVSVGSSNRVAVFSKIASGESGSYVFTWPNLAVLGFWIFCEYQGGGDYAIDVSGNVQNPLGVSSIAPSLSPASWNNYNTLVCVWAAALQVGDVMSMSQPLGMTLQAQSKSPAISFPALMLADLPLTSNADTGTKTATSAFSTPSLGVSLLIQQSIWAGVMPSGASS